MQIDFHHAMTYVLARLSDFSFEEANIIAYSSQYVDDAVIDNPARFKNGAIYKPICSAHKLLDYRNFEQLANHLAWVPFHFLPANCLLPEGDGVEEDFILRITCRPNSNIAKDMVSKCIRLSKAPQALYRLGITMHVYADTWAHQGFSGIQHHNNTVQYLKDTETSRNLLDKVTHFFPHLFDQKLSRFIDDVLPLGHGAVLSYPDLPYLKWEYHDFLGQKIVRNNTSEFLDAARNMFIALKRFKLGDPDAEVSALDENICSKISTLFSEFKDEDGNIRQKKWLEKIKQGEFGFDQDTVDYIPKGIGSWTYPVYGESVGDCIEKLDYHPEFIECHWKKFNDALRDHHYYLTRELFPRYNLCIT